MLVKDAFNVSTKTGDLGVEIEVEGSNLPNAGNKSAYWNITEDNSLRGENREFVYKKPLTLDKVSSSLDELYMMFESYKSSVDYNHRAGIHVHVNVQELTLRQLVSFISIYCIYEQSLLNFCNPFRRKNHFCLSTADATFIIEVLKSTLQSGEVSNLASDEIRYCSINLTSLSKYGSVEFRSLESTGDKEKIINWCSLLLKMRDYAKTVDLPTDLFNTASGAGHEEFTKQVFGEMFPVISSLVTYSTFYGGIRNIQHAVHSINWTSKDLNIFSKTKNVFLAP